MKIIGSGKGEIIIQGLSANKDEPILVTHITRVKFTISDDNLILEIMPFTSPKLKLSDVTINGTQLTRDNAEQLISSIISSQQSNVDNYNIGVTNTNNLESINDDKGKVIVNLTSDSTLVTDNITRDKNILITNTSSDTITITLPNSGNNVSWSNSTSFDLAAGSEAMISIFVFGDIKIIENYIR